MLEKWINMNSKKADEQLAAAIAEAEGKARERVITPEIVREELEAVTRYLGISKKALDGTVVVINPHAQSFPRSYKYTPRTTVIWARYLSGSWRICDISREDCRRYSHRDLVLSETAKTAVLDRVCKELF